MATRFDLTFDCVDGARLAEFWKLALGYEDEPPPPPFATREEWLASYGESVDDGPQGAWLRDPAGVGPRLCLLPVPEPKVAKNRLHVDVRVAGKGTPDERWGRIRETVDRLTVAGATTLATFEGHHVVMADPEGNEFCVA
ncbi:MAG TPA: VOC family protein [Acidimicrobiales bacterium]|nr:VOC family protein [Acidimicrobiales bacterium]